MPPSRLEMRIADHRDPLGLVRDSINAVYHRASVEGDEALRLVALTLLVDLARRRKEAGLPPIRNVMGGGAAAGRGGRH